MKEPHLSPFGDPDGSRGNLADLQPHFVEFENPLIWKGLAMGAKDHQARLLIGRKGSGKTFYLRRQQASAAKAPELFSAELEQRPPQTEEIIQFATKMGSGEVVEMWSLAWRRAALLSLMSHILCRATLRDTVPVEIRARLQEEYSPLLKYNAPQGNPLPVYGELSHILNSHNSRNGYKSYLTNHLWSVLEGDLAKAVRSCPPIFFYLDNIDESFERAPSFWRDCQLGLFRTVLDLLRDNRFGSRFHLTAALRDIVYLKALESEHGTRFLDDTYVRILDWDWHAAEFFLKTKISRLPNELFLRQPVRDRSIEEWLGVTEVRNSARKVLEPAQQYILRHTRLLPRDIVILGNRLCHELEFTRYVDEVDPDSLALAITRAAHFASRHFGNEQISIVAHHIAANLGAEIRKSSQVKDLIQQVKYWIKDLGRDRFLKKGFEELVEQGEAQFGEESRAVEALWLNGLLGYVGKHQGKECAVFYSDSREGEYEIPPDRSRYLLHSILIDAVGVRAVGKPVVQWSRGL